MDIRYMHLKALLQRKRFRELVEAMTLLLDGSNKASEAQVLELTELEDFSESIETWWPRVYEAVELTEFHGAPVYGVLPAAFEEFANILGADGLPRNLIDDVKLRPEYYLAGCIPRLGPAVGVVTQTFADGAIMAHHVLHFGNRQSNGRLDAAGKRVVLGAQAIGRPFSHLHDPRTRLPYTDGLLPGADE